MSGPADRRAAARPRQAGGPVLHRRQAHRGTRAPLRRRAPMRVSPPGPRARAPASPVRVLVGVSHPRTRPAASVRCAVAAVACANSAAGPVEATPRSSSAIACASRRADEQTVPRPGCHDSFSPAMSERSRACRANASVSTIASSHHRATGRGITSAARSAAHFSSSVARCRARSPSASSASGATSSSFAPTIVASRGRGRTQLPRSRAPEWQALALDGLADEAIRRWSASAFSGTGAGPRCRRRGDDPV